MSSHYSSDRAPPPAGWIPSAPHHSPPAMAPPYSAEEGQAGTIKYGLQFNDATIRAAFIRKVFSLVTVMLLVVAVMTAIPFLHDGTLHYVRNSPGLLFLALGIFIVVYVTLVCCDGVRRSHPQNLILLSIFTLSVGYMSMVITTQHSVESVLLTLIICTICCGGIVVFATQTKHDLTKFIGVMFILSMIIIVFGIVAIIASMVFKVRFLYLIYSLLASLLFMAYLAIDIQMLMGGKRHEISPEDHVFSAMQIFLDIIYIFWHLLAVIGGADN